MGIKRTELIRQIDLWPSKYFFRNKIGQKRQKYRKPNFPLYFFNGLLGRLNGLKWNFCRKQTLFKIQFYTGIHLSKIQIFNFENMITPSVHARSLRIWTITPRISREITVCSPPEGIYIHGCHEGSGLGGAMPPPGI